MGRAVDGDVHRPLFVFRFRLTPGDALAYQMLPTEIAGWRKVLLVAVAFLAGAAAGVVPEAWPLAWRWAAALLAGLIPAAGMLAAQRLLRLRMARRMASREGETVVEDHGDHLAIRSGSGTRFVPLEMLAQVLAGDGHVFIRHDGGPTIIPLRAFEGRADMQAYAEVLDRRSAEAVP